ncbi:hypothetical protein TRFO_28764 [Tritrichomonas foetus]|uniref:VWFA domain-containing protein n=1 Tax=Tritrichomonas foetus TaxID=1144522 RepID=A0A1J4K341_9EUKA|nr:hypothetical protein TRFO_28764 [Tritrichomonas foetus]|eukprot:OHT03917.1 hypothetical protein TRFO_28764 [Tritrichomonas foetus]
MPPGGRTKPVDLVFVLDATLSTQSIFKAMIDQVNDIGFDLHTTFRQAVLNYGAIIYRDPVDWRPLPPMPVFVNDGTYEVPPPDEDEDNNHYDLEKYPENRNVAIDLCDNIETIITELEKVKCCSGHDDPEDWVGALTLALNDIHWRDGKKCIVWIADANAHGKRYCGFDNHNEEEPKMEPLVRRLAEENFYFVGINVMKGTDTGCQITLREMKSIYERYHGKSFMIQEFKPVYDHQRYNDDNWPDDVLDMFMQTVAATLNRSMADAFDRPDDF